MSSISWRASNRWHGRKCAASQLALAWVSARGEDVVPIFGTKRREYPDENIAALHVRLTTDDLEQIEEIAPRNAVCCPRYPEAMMQLLNR